MNFNPHVPPVGRPQEHMMISSQANTSSKTTTITLSRADALKAAFVAAFLGASLVYTTGFAQPAMLHNAAHDSRHALNFPCH